MNQDRSVRWSKSFGNKPDEVDSEEQAALFYFDYLRRQPNLVRDVASVSVAQLYASEGKYDMAIKQLKIFAVANRNRLKQIDRHDRNAMHNEHGTLIHGLRRPLFDAFFLLAMFHKARGNLDEAIQVERTIIEMISEDGWYWQANMSLGALYGEVGNIEQAHEQYTTALAGFLRRLQLLAGLYKRRGVAWENTGWQVWEKNLLSLKKALASAGSKSALDTKEINALRTKYIAEKRSLEAPLKQIESILTNIDNHEGDYQRPEARRKYVESLDVSVLENPKDKRKCAVAIIALCEDEKLPELRKAYLRKARAILDAIVATPLTEAKLTGRTK